ncbi:TetR/AcrR family transcriptional regulator [Aliiruegeria lutimaris]|uniref:Transcriptional regulator, TetR family n=1 Tax=Aliiruegeria lutimaris TaxID=571298 RepID=A0A1G9AYW8_9RHOB|nr:TetR/AcrR family transcriptional regulator [Aliiruegeria lutimaris]SDK31785.1 transcriptional regulator, TetR family [Aliiruegeria lutimaris]
MARKTGSHAEITGPRIRDAALRLFARHGYAAVSMRQIAAEVGVQAGALYAYTSDKQALLFDLMKGHMEHLLGSWKEVARSADPAQQLETFVRFHIRYHLDRPDEVFISYMELRNLEPENFVALESLRRRYEDALQDILTEGCAAGQFTISDTRVAVMGLIAMLTGVSTWFRESGRLSRSDVEQVYWDMTRRAVGLAG